MREAAHTSAPDVRIRGCWRFRFARRLAAPYRLAFFWENLGPYHADRLQALAAEGGPALRITAIQYFSRSEVYAWSSVAGDRYDTVTLFPYTSVRPGILRTARALARACLRTGAATIFLCNYQEPAVFVAAALLRLRGRRVVCMIDSKFDDYTRRLPREVLKSVMLRPYTGAFTASLRSREYLRFLGFAPERIALGYDTVDVDRLLAASGAPLAPEGVPFAERDFVIIARHVLKKNIAMGLESFALWLARTSHPRDLHLCGSGPLEPELRAQAARLGVADRVHFHGFVQTEAVSRILASGLALILPSTEEQYGLVVAEALALGVPVLCTSNAGAVDVLVEPGCNGFIIDPSKPEGCAALMALLSENEESWRRFAAAAAKSRFRGDCLHFVAGVRQLVGL